MKNTTDLKFSHANIAEFTAKCQENMLSNGLPCGDELILDGDRHRYSADENPRPDEWYIGSIEIINGKTVLSCTYGSFSTDSRFTYRSSDAGTVTPEEINDLKGRRERVKAIKEAETKLKHDKVAHSLLTEYQGTKKSPPKMNMLPWKPEDARYLRTKNIKQYECARWPIKFYKYTDGDKRSFRCMVIPIINIDNKLRSCEYIYYDGAKCEKRFKVGGEKRGNFYILEGIGEFYNREKSNVVEKIYIVEGYATGASVFDLLRCIKPTYKYWVVVAFDAGNICPVAGNLRKKFSSQEITICTDDDGKGHECADLACQLYNCKKITVKGVDGE